MAGWKFNEPCGESNIVTAASSNRIKYEGLQEKIEEKKERDVQWSWTERGEWQVDGGIWEPDAHQTSWWRGDGGSSTRQV